MIHKNSTSVSWICLLGRGGLTRILGVACLIGGGAWKKETMFPCDLMCHEKRPLLGFTRTSRAPIVRNCTHCIPKCSYRLGSDSSTASKQVSGAAAEQNYLLGTGKLENQHSKHPQACLILFLGSTCW